MEQKGSAKLPAQSLLYLLIYAGGILGFVLLAIYPYQKFLAELDRDITRIETQIEEQKILFPVYKDLSERASVKRPVVLPFPQKAKLDRNETERISFIFEEIARKSNLELSSIVPDVTSLLEESGLLSVSALMKGNYFDFRNFLTELGGIPYLEHIEEIRIQPSGGAKEFRLKVWLALNK